VTRIPQLCLTKIDVQNLSEDRLLASLAGKLIAHFSAKLKNALREVHRELQSDKQVGKNSVELGTEAKKAPKERGKQRANKNSGKAALASKESPAGNEADLIERVVSRLLKALSSEEDEDEYDPPEPGELQSDIERIGNHGK